MLTYIIFEIDSYCGLITQLSYWYEQGQIYLEYIKYSETMKHKSRTGILKYLNFTNFNIIKHKNIQFHDDPFMHHD